MSVTFEWDSAKALENIRKHGVEFEEAATSFLDPLSLTIPDPDRSDSDERWILVGLSGKHRLLVVVHTDKGDKIRLISARAASPRERRAYEEM